LTHTIPGLIPVRLSILPSKLLTRGEALDIEKDGLRERGFPVKAVAITLRNVASSTLIP
jgi:hypothetical protein